MSWAKFLAGVMLPREPEVGLVATLGLGVKCVSGFRVPVSGGGGCLVGRATFQEDFAVLFGACWWGGRSS